jgi:hypothetical protein
MASTSCTAASKLWRCAVAEFHMSFGVKKNSEDKTVYNEDCDFAEH